LIGGGEEEGKNGVVNGANKNLSFRKERFTREKTAMKKKNEFILERGALQKPPQLRFCRGEEKPRAIAQE